MKKPPLQYPLPKELVEKLLRMLGEQPDADACWHWSKCSPEGYPYISFNGTEYSAAAVSFMHFVGPLKPGFKVVRRCGRHSCVNPSHLFLGHPNATTDENLEERFNKKIVRSLGMPKAGLDKPCLLWKSSIKSGKYGTIKWRGKRRPATHAAWFLKTRRMISEGKVAMHECDDPRCVEFTHLKEGTPGENNRDRTKKGRSAKGDAHGTQTHPESVPKGEDHGMSKFTADEVVLIRRTYDAYPDLNGRVDWLMRHLKRKRYAVWCIAKRKTWKHIPEDARPEIVPVPLDVLKKHAPKWPRGDERGGCKISDRQVRELRFLAFQNAGRKGLAEVLAKRFGVSRRLATAVISRQKRSEIADDFEKLGSVNPLVEDSPLPETM